VILSNERDAAPHNAALECFATSRREQAAALAAYSAEQPLAGLDPETIRRHRKRLVQRQGH